MQLLSLVKPLGVDLFCTGKKFLVYNLVSRNLKIKYRRSVLGLFWTLVAPMGTAAVYYYVFKVILAIQVPHYLNFILIGVLFWNAFSQTIMEGMESIVGNWGLASKIPIPLQVFPYTGALTNYSTLILATPVVVGVWLFTGLAIRPAFGFIFFYTVALFLISYATSYMLAMAFVVFRDLRHLMGILMQIWFYATPVIYQADMIPEKYHWMVYVNPVGSAFVGLQDAAIAGTIPHSHDLIATAFWAVATIFGAAICHRKFASGIVERI